MIILKLVFPRARFGHVVSQIFCSRFRASLLSEITCQPCLSTCSRRALLSLQHVNNPQRIRAIYARITRERKQKTLNMDSGKSQDNIGVVEFIS